VAGRLVNVFADNDQAIRLFNIATGRDGIGKSAQFVGKIPYGV